MTNKKQLVQTLSLQDQPPDIPNSSYDITAIHTCLTEGIHIQGLNDQVGIHCLFTMLPDIERRKVLDDL